jgi:hypothetical protein
LKNQGDFKIILNSSDLIIKQELNCFIQIGKMVYFDKVKREQVEKCCVVKCQDIIEKEV